MNEKHYQGKPCKYGHSGLRYKSTRYCIVCNGEKSTRNSRTEVGRASARNRHILKKYGLTYDEMLQILGGQGGKCSICDTEIVLGGRTDNSACVDHDHKTGKIRGLLCNNCNRGLGMFKDNRKRLENAIKYLDGFIYAIRDIPESWLE